MVWMGSSAERRDSEGVPRASFNVRRDSEDVPQTSSKMRRDSGFNVCGVQSSKWKPVRVHLKGDR